MTKILTVLMLMMFSMGVSADVKIFYGEKGEELKTGETKIKGDNGTIAIEQKASDDGSQTTIYLTFIPETGYTISSDNIEVYAVISTGSGSTRTPEISGDPLGLTEESSKDPEKRYSVKIDSKLGLWIKKAEFTKKDNGGSKGNRSLSTDVDYSGTYYIASKGYDGNPNTTDNYYLCPTEDWIYYKATNDWDTNGTTYPNPFLTTFKCKSNAYHSGDPSNAVWIIEKHPTEDYYYIKHKSDGKYMVSNGKISGSSNANRMRVHLETVAQADLDDKALFSINTYYLAANGTSPYLVISPKSEDGWNKNQTVDQIQQDLKWYTVNNGNQPYIDKGYGKNDGPENRATGGIIGLYTEYDGNAQFYFEDVITRPTITYNNTSNKITITAAQTGTVTIKYTTDGSTPSSTNGETYSAPFALSEGVTTIKTITIGTDWVSNVATFTNHKRLIQSQNNAWNDTDFHFYMIPGDEASGITKVNTTSLFRPSMEWTFQSASVEKGIQYYYIINNANGKYLCYDATNSVYMDDFGSGDNKFKFFMVESSLYPGTFHIKPYGLDILVSKNNGNASSDPINTVGNNKDITKINVNAFWKFIQPTDLDTDAPFTVSDATSSNYYKIASVGSNGYYIVPPSGTNTNATTSNVSAENMKWCFEVAQAPTSDDWLTYYYIRNAETCDYLYFTKDANNAGACLEMRSAKDEESKDRYMFTWTKTADANANYYIIPKNLKDISQNQFSALQRDGGTLKTNVTRGAGNYAWKFEPSTFKCETPVINYDPLTGKISVTCGTTGATIYVAHYATAPSDSDIPALIAENVYTDEFNALPGYYKAVASRSTGGEDVSDAATSDKIEEFHCMRPIIKKTSNHVSITCGTPGATIYYIAGSGEFSENADNYGGTVYDPETGFDTSETVIKAIAVKDAEWSTKSAEALYDKTPTTITSGTQITNMDGVYIVGDSFTPSSTPIGSATDPFTGEFDGNFKAFELSHPLFAYVNGATIKNVIISKANNISTSGNAGAIANVANGDSRIYNCGVLATSVLKEDPDDEEKITGFSGSSVSGGGYVGGIVGLLDGTSRVINCFSYANILAGSERGGIVGHNNYPSKADNIDHIRTMVMNCMFYGDITGGGAPIYGGENIDNLKENDGLNTFNFYCYETLQGGIPDAMYHCALAVEQKYLTRFEFYRQLLNSNKKLAAIYATGSADNAAGKMAKWVLETADRTIDSPLPFPVLKAQGYYPSIINIDDENAPSIVMVDGKPSETDRKKGGKLGELTVNISIGSGKPEGAKIKTGKSQITLNRTVMDEDRYNFNYDKVQLPYYSEVGEGNYTGYKVVTGWKITGMSKEGSSSYDTGDKWGGYNFADRNCTGKDLYDTSGRVFSQGAYFDVPYGVTSIDIEPYWGNAAYLADQYYDVVYAANYERQDISLLGTQVDGNTKFNDQVVKYTVSSALSTITTPGSTVYDNAIVLVGNFHQNNIGNKAPYNGSTPFTIMSVDEDEDNEPDYSLIYHDNARSSVCPIRFDFLNMPGTAQAQKPNATATVLNASVFNPTKWFEITNTCLIYFSQFEYENVSKSGDAPVILLGGVYDQFVSTKVGAPATTTYLHVGGNAWFKDFGNGTHSDGSGSTTHIPISVTGGDFDGFYLTSTYTASTTIKNDDAECYISGGHFKEAAGAGLEKIGGNVHWQIYNADIDNFYGGGVTAPSTIQGDVTVDIFNSYVTNYCGGPKFGDMQSGKKVTTNATSCEFDQYYGAGYGGASVKRQKYTDNTTYDFTTLQNRYATSSGDRGKYFNGSTTEVRSHDNALYGYKGPGVATDFDYEFFVWTSGKVGARFFVKFSAFSLAQCNDVESNLTNCTIKGNFYGGGKLGKVSGTVTSVLDGCKVKGNAFGAGFSASYEDVKVRKAGFASNDDIPKFNALSGMFEPGKMSGTDTYTWKNAAEADVTLTEGGSGSNSTDLIYTDVELTDENLGTVAGSVNLTIKGNSVIGTEGVGNTGNVYGGGDESYVTGSANKITVTLAGNTQVLGNVFGGGNEGLVEGSTEVNIQENAPTNP